MGREPHAEGCEIEALRSVALNMGQTGDFGLKAMRINARILELAPDDFAARVRRGKCHKERDDYPAAKKLPRDVQPACHRPSVSPNISSKASNRFGDGPSLRLLASFD